MDFLLLLLLLLLLKPAQTDHIQHFSFMVNGMLGGIVVGIQHSKVHSFEILKMDEQKSLALLIVFLNELVDSDNEK